MVRRAVHRSDSNQDAIVQALRKAGYTVAVCSQAGGGYPDLHAAKHGCDHLLEVKDPARATAAQRNAGPYSVERLALLDPAQRRFVERWPRLIPIVFWPEEALEVMRDLP